MTSNPLPIWLLDFFYLTSGIGLITGVLVCYKYRNYQAVYLLLISVLYSLMLWYGVKYWIGAAKHLPRIAHLIGGTVYLINPIFYRLVQARPIAKRYLQYDLLEFIPFAVFAILLFTHSLSYHIYFFTMVYCMVYLFLVYKEWKTIHSHGIAWIAFSFVGYGVSYTFYEALLATNLITPHMDYLITASMTFFILALLIKSYLNAPFMYVQRELKYLTPEMTRPIVDKVINYLVESEKYLNGNYKLNDLANDMNLSSHQLSEALNAEDNGFTHTLHTLRIDKAKKLLTETNYSSIQVAYSSGFNNKVSFYKTFKKFTGMTPKDWKESSALTSNLSEKSKS